MFAAAVVEIALFVAAWQAVVVVAYFVVAEVVWFVASGQAVVVAVSEVAA